MSTRLKEYFPMIPERLNDFLSQMPGQEVRIVKILPADSTRIADESSLLIMDIVVELEDGSIANLEMQKYLFISLDIFRKNEHNTDEIKKRDAWLLLLSDDNPNTIIELTDKYPEFREIYEEGYEICRNTERVMDMFSKELYELDKNTVQYMIDEMQETIDRQENIINVRENTISEQEKLINELRRSIKTIINFMRNSKTPEEEIRKYLIENCRFSVEQVEELLSS